MSLRFIIGRAGSGKTSLCLSEVCAELESGDRGADGPALIVLVPEQATFQMEYALLGRLHTEGTHRAQVLSFRRLASRVLAEVGGASRPYLSELGKIMALRSIVQRRRDDLRIFSLVTRQAGFIECLSNTLAELRAYNISLGGVKSRLAALEHEGLGGSQLALKLHDLAIIYEDFQAYLDGRFTDPCDYLDLLSESLPASGLVTGSYVWVDGFTGFTPQEFIVLGKLMQAAARITVAICMDPLCVDPTICVGPPPGPPGRTQAPESAGVGSVVGEFDPFFPTWETYRRLLDIARESHVEVEDTVVVASRGRFTLSAPLAHLEREFFARPWEPFDGDAAPGVRLVAASNPRVEVEGVAREIVRLCRDEGYRWREIGLIIRDAEMERYAPLVTSVFRDYGIPFFLDYKRPVQFHPLVELIRSALEVVNSNWAYEPVFRYLKTDLVPVSREDVDILENYVLAHGIRGRAWTSGAEWRYLKQFALGEDREPDEAGRLMLERINSARDIAVNALGRFYSRVCTMNGGKRANDDDGLTVRYITAALFELLDELGVAETLESWRASEEARGDIESARGHVQVWSGVMELFDQVVEGLGDLHVSVEEYSEIIDVGLRGLRLGLIPPGLDQVVVGSVERSRHPSLRAAFVIGVNDGVFPARCREDSILDDGEREELGRRGMELGPTSEEKLLREQYLTYVAFTRAGERLWISYPIADEKGRGLLPSLYIRRLREVFPNLQEEFISEGPPADGPALASTPGRQGASPNSGAGAPGPGMLAVRVMDYITSVEKAAAYVARELRDARSGRPPGSIWLDIYEWLVGDEQRRERAAVSLSGLWYSNHVGRLPCAITSRLYPNPLCVSVSALERFAACPFQYFARDALRLLERDEFKVEAPELGVLFHAALKEFVERLARDRVSWAELDPADAARIIGEIVENLSRELRNEILLSSARYVNLVRIIKRTLARAVTALGEHARRGRFAPVAVEVRFGSGERVPGLRFDLGGGRLLELRGQIDRIDAVETEAGETGAGADGAGALYLRVIDYKSSRKGLDISHIYHGLSLQLPAYLAVAVEHARAFARASSLAGIPSKPVRPAGMLYFGVRDPLLSLEHKDAVTAEDGQRRLLKALRMDGLVLGEPAVVRMMDVEGSGELVPASFKKDGSLDRRSKVATAEQFDLLIGFIESEIVKLGRRIISGDISPEPYRDGPRRPCTYCEYMPLCGFDILIDGSRYRDLVPVKGDEVWEMMRRELDRTPDEAPDETLSEMRRGSFGGGGA
ncbi:MAG: helicase-exonuclease AddAB subunit AddB [Firmicutes bacterium]|nr:helicase-exonuclease AddAB subunit AddB [Bacillota bacterium]